MIVISGALVAIALVLLVIGLTTTVLGFIYASIAVSAVSCVFLLIGILQRRGEGDALSDGDSTVDVPVAVAERPFDAGIVVPRAAAAAQGREAVETDDDEPASVGAPRGMDQSEGSVLVVAGRPRYHVDGCRYLTGKAADSVDVADARDEGFTACGVCHPDETLAAAGRPDERVLAAVTPELVEAPTSVLELDAEPIGSITPRSSGRSDGRSSAPAPRVPVPTTRTATNQPAKTVTRSAPRVPSKTTTRTPATPAGSKTGTSSSPARPGRKAAAPAARPTRTATPTPSRTAAKAAASSAPAAPRRGIVVVIPDRGRYHRADCRYVRGATDSQELTKAQATRQGYDACGVCAP